MNIGSASMNLPLTSINTALIFLELLLKADEFIVAQIDVDDRLKRHRAPYEIVTGALTHPGGLYWPVAASCSGP